MAYATIDMFVHEFGEPAVRRMLNQVGDEPLDTARIETALNQASAELDDAFRPTGAVLPLASPGAFIVSQCLDIARYRLANSSDVMDDEIRKRYENVKARLDQIKDYAAPPSTGAFYSASPRRGW